MVFLGLELLEAPKYCRAEPEYHDALERVLEDEYPLPILLGFIVLNDCQQEPEDESGRDADGKE